MWSRLQHLSARTALISLAVLDVLGVLLADLAAALSESVTTEPVSQAILTAIYLSLVWAVWRHSAVARWALVVVNALSALTIVVFSIGFTLIDIALAFDLVSLVLLFAPRVRAHVKAAPVPDPAR